MIRRALLLGALIALSAAPVAAQGSPTAAAVARARAAGIVGERYDGYLGIARGATPMLSRQVSSINLMRRSLYSQLAQARRVSLQEIGITAGCQLLGTVRVGETYFGPVDGWRMRGPAEQVPVPSYCR